MISQRDRCAQGDDQGNAGSGNRGAGYDLSGICRYRDAETGEFSLEAVSGKDQKKVIASDCGNTTYALPEKEEYHKEVYGEHATYTREMVKEDLRSVLFSTAPALFTTSEEDTHGDHAGLYLFLREILKELEKEDYPSGGSFAGWCIHRREMTSGLRERGRGLPVRKIWTETAV